MYKIAYITSSRADYGIVRNYLSLLNQDENIDLEILATGMILQDKYGAGYKLIEQDGLKIAYKVDLKLYNTDNIAIIDSMALCLKEFGRIFTNNKYDLVITLGDRNEIMSAVIAAAMNKQKILHIHGGEKTLGNYDEFFRHCITKMSLYHFASTEEYKNRIIQMGENPDNVFNIGAMGCENCLRINNENIIEELKALNLENMFVVLFHPETITYNSPLKQINTLLDSIQPFLDNYKFIFLGTNSDTGSNEIRYSINEFVKKNDNAFYFENINPDSYHYILQKAISLIGNSSSGIIEAPTLGCLTINIGDRQKGRIRGSSVLDIKCDKQEIEKAINESIEKYKEKKEVERFDNPYYKENSIKNAYETTKKILEKNDSFIKEFYDMKN